MDVFRIGPWQCKLDIQYQPYEVAYTTINLIKIRSLLDFFQFCYLSTQQISIILISDLNISIGSGFCYLFYDVFSIFLKWGFPNFHLSLWSFNEIYHWHYANNVDKSKLITQRFTLVLFFGSGSVHSESWNFGKPLWKKIEKTS
jgi:chromosome condensin MukBEF MukE localization factor